MTELMPLRRAVIEITHEASPNNLEENRRAIRGWHNRLQNGTIPRELVFKLGRELFLDLKAWEAWISKKGDPQTHKNVGRPRTN